MDGQHAAVVIDEAKLPELLHKATDPRPGCADHLRQAILTDSGEYGFGPAFPAVIGEQQEDLSQATLA